MGLSITMKGMSAEHGQVQPDADHEGLHRGRSGGAARLGRDRHGGRRRQRAARLLQGRRRSPPARSGSSTACATRSRATWPRSTPTARISLLGRGSQVINTAGEKVFPEEVEEAVKRLAAVEDCLVVGVPDDRFGEAVAAVVSLAPRGRHRRRRRSSPRSSSHLAGYKAPKHVVFVEPGAASAKRQGRLPRREGAGPGGPLSQVGAGRHVIPDPRLPGPRRSGRRLRRPEAWPEAERPTLHRPSARPRPPTHSAPSPDAAPLRPRRFGPCDSLAECEAARGAGGSRALRRAGGQARNGRADAQPTAGLDPALRARTDRTNPVTPILHTLPTDPPSTGGVTPRRAPRRSPLSPARVGLDVASARPPHPRHALRGRPPMRTTATTPPPSSPVHALATSPQCSQVRPRLGPTAPFHPTPRWLQGGSVRLRPHGRSACRGSTGTCSKARRQRAVDAARRARPGGGRVDATEAAGGPGGARRPRAALAGDPGRMGPAAAAAGSGTAAPGRRRCPPAVRPASLRRVCLSLLQLHGELALRDLHILLILYGFTVGAVGPSRPWPTRSGTNWSRAESPVRSGRLRPAVARPAQPRPDPHLGPAPRTGIRRWCRTRRRSQTSRQRAHSHSMVPGGFDVMS